MIITLLELPLFPIDIKLHNQNHFHYPCLSIRSVLLPKRLLASLDIKLLNKRLFLHPIISRSRH